MPMNLGMCGPQGGGHQHGRVWWRKKKKWKYEALLDILANLASVTLAPVYSYIYGQKTYYHLSNFKLFVESAE